MKNILRFSAALLLLLIATSIKSQSAKDLILPLDQEVKYGVLVNGMTYYIKHNEEPKNRASFYMIQNVGAILEEDSQNGLAHFLEHMAFNGTEHFPEKGILNTLQKHGVAFGYNINAYTSTDETVYNLSEIPTDKPGLLDTCLLVLNDWSNYLLLTEEEIEAERGVISEEWRTRRNARFRMYRESAPYIYNNSKFSKRDVIGDLDVIKNFKYDQLRSFYHDWYRTDLQAVAVVGDFDADEMEQKVINLLSKVPAVENTKNRDYVEIPDNEEMIFGLVTDKEAEQSSITIYIREKVAEPGIENAEQLREEYIESLFNRMMSQRISELLQKGEPPFVMGSVYRTSLNRNYDVSYFTATAKTNEEELALSTILQEVERVKKHGFTDGE
ncbi:MAG: pitrilysin family protein, partial [Bacteroidales bacterium]|nr:pitrilysin family protein [Bacteroidales bacterium]